MRNLLRCRNGKLCVLLRLISGVLICSASGWVSCVKWIMLKLVRGSVEWIQVHSFCYVTLMHIWEEASIFNWPPAWANPPDTNKRLHHVLWTIKVSFSFWWSQRCVLQAESIRVLVTGAAGQIAYSLLFSIAKGDVFGKDQVKRSFGPVTHTQKKPAATNLIPLRWRNLQNSKK